MEHAQKIFEIDSEAHFKRMELIRSWVESFQKGIGDTVADIALGAREAGEAFAQLGKQMAGMIISYMTQRAVAAVIEKTLAAAGIGVLKAAGVASIGVASGVASAWAAAATASAIATGGGSLAAAAGVPGLMATNAALGSAIALAGSLGGAAHGGLTNVPAETTFLLQRGERVLSPNQNTDLVDFMRSGGRSGTHHYHVEVNGRELFQIIHDASRDGQLTIDGRALE
jgi:hypothetical protein